MLRKIIIALVFCCLASGCRQSAADRILTRHETERHLPQQQSLQGASPSALSDSGQHPATSVNEAQHGSAKSEDAGAVEAPNEPVPSASVPAQPPAANQDQEKAATPSKPRPSKKQAPPSKAPTVPVQKTQASGGKKLTLSELRAKYPQSFKLNGASKEKKIALTFDDGPDLRFTPQVLDVLKQYGVKATFFLVGRNAAKHPEIVKRIVKEGHVVGNHSYNHPLFTKLTVEQVAQEIDQTSDLLLKLAGYRPKLVRPPYGAIDEEQLLWAQHSHLIVVNWNVDSLDWKSLKEEQVSRNILGHTKAGAIVLQHSAGASSQDLSGTVKALPGIIEKLRGEGYDLVTVPELLKIPK